MNKGIESGGVVDTKFSRKLGDFLYICKRAGIAYWLFPSVLASLGLTLTGSVAYTYVGHYKKAIAGTIEKNIITEGSCDDVLIQKAQEKGIENCKNIHRLSTTAGITTESVQSILDSEYPRIYGNRNEQLEYPEGKRPNGEPTPADGTSIETRTYTKQGEFLGIFPRYAPHVELTYKRRQNSYELNPSQGNTSFQQATKFRLTPENLPSDYAIQQLAQKLKDEVRSDSSIDIVGNSSPEGSEPSALVDSTSPSYEKNLQLARERAEYVKKRLVEFAPELKGHINTVDGLVRLLTPDDINALNGVIKRQGIDMSGISGIDKMIERYEKGRLRLSTEDEETIKKIFHRKTLVTHIYSKPATTGSHNFEFEMDSDYNLLALLPILFMAVFGTYAISRMLYQRGLEKVYTDYTDKGSDPEKRMIASQILSDEEKKEAQADAE